MYNTPVCELCLEEITDYDGSSRCKECKKALKSKCRYRADKKHDRREERRHKYTVVQVDKAY